MYTLATYRFIEAQQDTLNNKKASIPVQNMQDSTANVPKKKVYTQAQIRNWRLQQENKLTINDSKYVPARDKLEVHAAEQPTPNFILPIRHRNETNTDWLTAIIFLAIILLATVRYAYAKYMEHLFLSIFNYATSARMLQEKSYPVFHGAYRLDAIFYLCLPILIFQAIVQFNWINFEASPLSFTLIFAGVLLYFFAIKFLYWMLGNLFQSTSETREYLFNLDNFNRSLGIILLPLVVLIGFAPVKKPEYIVLFALFSVLIFKVLLLQRGIYILLKKQFSIFYLFLYLCTLEFLPLLLIYKIVVE